MKMLASFKKMTGYLMVVTAVGLLSCGDNNETEGDEVDVTVSDAATNANQYAVATLSGTNPDTTVTGTVRFDGSNAGKTKMMLQISVPKKANSSVAVHIHEHGDCGEMAQHAGGHWNPTGTNHGKWGSSSFHAGDIGNIDLDASGNGSVEVESDLWSVGGDEKTNVLNKTIVVHSGVDDYTSQPSGNSGSRIGCGVIQQSNQ